MPLSLLPDCRPDVTAPHGPAAVIRAILSHSDAFLAIIDCTLNLARVNASFLNLILSGMLSTRKVTSVMGYGQILQTPRP